MAECSGCLDSLVVSLVSLVHSLACCLPNPLTDKTCLAYGRRSTRDSSYQSSHPPRGLPLPA